MAEPKPIWTLDPNKADAKTLASLGGMANLIATFFHALVHRGMTRDEALLCTTEWMRLVIKAPNDP